MIEKCKTVKWWQWMLLAFTLIAAVFKIYIGIDNDEAYIVTMGIRLLNGDRMFDTMWDLHMTSAWPVWFFTDIFVKVTGGVTGLVIYLRMISTLIQFGVAYVVYTIMKKYYYKTSAFLTAMVVANFLPRATQNLEYGLLEMLFITLSCTILYDAIREKKDKIAQWKVVISAICYSMAILTYPTLVISFPIFLIVLVTCQQKKIKRWKLPIVFIWVCCVCAIVFFAYIFSYISITEFFQNLRGILSDGTHSDTMKVLSYGKQFVTVLARSLIICGFAGAVYLVFRKKMQEKTLIYYDVIAMCALVIIGFNITGIRPSGPIGLQVRYILLTIMAAAFFSKMKFYGDEDKMLFRLFYLPGIIVYVGVLFGSNMGLEENASFFYLCIFTCVLLATENTQKMSKYNKIWAMSCMIVFVFSIIFIKGYLVRIVGTGAANIMEERIAIEDGVLKGVYLYPADAEKYLEKIAEIGEYSDETDTILYLGDNAFCNLAAKGSFTSASCISTPYYNNQWIQYYENEEHPQPTVLFLDKDLIRNMEQFHKYEFAGYLEDKYGFQDKDFIETDVFYIVEL